MQKTRHKILEYLRQHGEASVEDLSHALDDLTAVTVRHHLDVLRSQGMISAPESRQRATPGRPRYVYTLTEQARSQFPQNVNTLTHHLLDEIKNSMGEGQINVIFEGVATRMASDFEDGPADEPFEDRLIRIVDHLSAHGYDAHWEAHPEGYILHTSNCPYHQVVEGHPNLCLLDVQYISRLLGRVPRRMTHLVEGAESCSYLIVNKENAYHVN